MISHTKALNIVKQFSYHCNLCLVMTTLCVLVVAYHKGESACDVWVKCTRERRGGLQGCERKAAAVACVQFCDCVTKFTRIEELWSISAN